MCICSILTFVCYSCFHIPDEYVDVDEESLSFYNVMILKSTQGSGPGRESFVEDKENICNINNLVHVFEVK